MRRRAARGRQRTSGRRRHSGSSQHIAGAGPSADGWIAVFAHLVDALAMRPAKLGAFARRSVFAGEFAAPGVAGSAVAYSLTGVGRQRNLADDQGERQGEREAGAAAQWLHRGRRAPSATRAARQTADRAIPALHAARCIARKPGLPPGASGVWMS